MSPHGLKCWAGQSLSTATAVPDGGKTPWALNAVFGRTGVRSQEHIEVTGYLDIYSLASNPQIYFFFLAAGMSVSFPPAGSLTQYPLSLEG